MVSIAKESWNLIKEAAWHWKADNAQRLGAALAYYAVLALPPILVILLFIVSLFYQGSASSQFSQQFNQVLGPRAGHLLQTLMSNPQTHGHGPVATGIAIVALLVSATGFFVELENALNTVWGVEERPDIGWKGLILKRLVSFLLIIGIGILLVLSLLASTVLAGIHKTLGGAIPGGPVPWRAAEFIASFVIVTLLFALIYKLLPDVKIAWRDVWVGAALTAVLFSVGKMLLGFYLGYSSVASPYGVAGSLVLVLVWVYYSAQIFLFGAEFTQAYANRFGKSIVPSRRAKWRIESETAAEDREEAEIGTKRRRGTQPASAAPALPQPSRQASPEHEKGAAPSSAGEQWKILRDIADHIHSWHALHP